MCVTVSDSLCVVHLQQWVVISNSTVVDGKAVSEISAEVLSSPDYTGQLTVLLVTTVTVDAEMTISTTAATTTPALQYSSTPKPQRSTAYTTTSKPQQTTMYATTPAPQQSTQYATTLKPPDASTTSTPIPLSETSELKVRYPPACPVTAFVSYYL
jgi:hypothetical protein